MSKPHTDTTSVSTSSTPAAAPHVDTVGIDQALDSAQASLDALSGKSEPLDSAAIASSEQSPSSQSLAEIDQSIAADLDNLLQGEYETIDAVLDGVFDEKAAIVQKLSESAIAPSPQQSIRSRAVDEPEAGNSLEPPPEPEGAQQPISSPEPQAYTMQEVRETAQPAVEPFAPVEPTEHLVAVKKIDPADSGPIIAVQPQRIIEQESLNSVPEDKLPVQPRMILAVAAQPVVSVLTLVNYPIRFLPTNLRPALNWVAISLAVWAPIVWIMAMTWGQQRPAEAVSSAAHESPAATAHEKPIEKSKSAAPAKGHASHSKGH